MGQTILGLTPDRYASDAWTGRPGCEVCTDVDADAVKALYLSTLAHAAASA